MQKEGLRYKETAQRLEIGGHSRIQAWERVYLTEEPESFAAERCQRKRRRQLGRSALFG